MKTQQRCMKMYIFFIVAINWIGLLQQTLLHCTIICPFKLIEIHFIGTLFLMVKIHLYHDLCSVVWRLIIFLSYPISKTSATWYNYNNEIVSCHQVYLLLFPVNILTFYYLHPFLDLELFKLEIHREYKNRSIYWKFNLSFSTTL